MSKHNSGRPEAKSPAPTPQAASTRADPVAEKTEAKKTPEAIPAIPNDVRGVAAMVLQKWGVPLWLTILASWTGSRFHQSMKGANNACGIMAIGTMPSNEQGRAWFGNVPISYDQFGYVCVKDLALDFSNPEACVKALKARCPEIDTTDYKLFKETT
jgi:hypothetical protein